MGEAGRKRALEMFSWERTADSLLEHFKAVLSR
jgi:glycosyltransferase involved in cell wall biosynthesis